MTETLPLSRMIAYSIGQLGWSTLINIITFRLTPFYLPPDDPNVPLEQKLPVLIIPIVLGISTLSLVAAAGRLWDAVTDPLIANLSDRWNSRFGRRIPFLALGALPAGLFCLTVFTPPHEYTSTLNLVWMSASLILFYLFLTIYVTPYFAMIPELGHTPVERLNISTLISVTYAIGIVIAFSIPVIADTLHKSMGLSMYNATQYAIALLCFFSVIWMYVPVLYINEKKYCKSEPSAVPFKEALVLTFKNKDFLYFTFSDFNYFLSTVILSSGLSYYIVVLLHQPDTLGSLIGPAMLLSSFVCYPFVNLFARKFGKKKLVIVGFWIFFLVFVFIYFMGSAVIPFPGLIQIFLMAVVAGIPMAILGILPNAILADIAELDALKTGSRREGLFYAARTLMQKLGQTVGVFILSNLVIIGGNSTVNEFGVRLTGPVAAFFCLLAIFLFSKYKEKETLEEIERIERK